jgi:hypothetical protein
MVESVTYLFVNPVGNADIVTSWLILATALAIEKPHEHLQLRSIIGAVNRNEVVAPADLIDFASHRLRCERQLLAVPTLDVPPHVFGHVSSTAGLGCIMVTECRTERQVAADKWSHDLVDQRVCVARTNPFARHQVAIENDKIRLLIVKNRVDDTNRLEVCIGTTAQGISYKC